MNKKEKKKYQVLETECYDRDCFVPFQGNGRKICRLYELGRCPKLKYCSNCQYWIREGFAGRGECMCSNSYNYNKNIAGDSFCVSWKNKKGRGNEVNLL